MPTYGPNAVPFHRHTNDAEIAGPYTVVLHTTSGTQTVANTTNETTLLSAGPGSLTIPAYTIKVGTEIRGRVWGIYSTTGNPNITFKFKLGVSTLINSGAFSAGNNVTNQLFYIDVRTTCNTTGATGSFWSQGYGKMFTAHATNVDFDLETSAAVAVNTTVDNAIDLTVTWGTGVSANTITKTNGGWELLNYS